MKFKTNNKILSLIIAGSLIAASAPVLALTGDTEQPIHIDSAQQSLDMQGNTVTFTGDVVVTQGT
ncbi:MAG: lipopolysaccharide ABC transporter substrate-binding protein LptA, partial [Enterobacterales bacterium]|nr:lipopolysaccharide ABC transporter substrate-binding protein LptA [Enterobacterales bacterium]